MNKILLTPHADDETLFACYTLIREQPLVVLCLPGAPRHGSLEVRLAEFSEAMDVLGCPWVSLAREGRDFLDADDQRILGRFKADHVYAPLPEPDGNDDHNLIGDLAIRLWPDRVTFYTTYTTDRTTHGYPVPADPAWADLKRQALACYKSQQANRGTREHFERPLDEYLVSDWQQELSA